MNQLHNIHKVHDGLFNSTSGLKISLKNPLPETINISDIASGLSKICRFGGQIDEFYSVAQHSILVCELAPDHLKFEALMHDSPEAYLGDVIKPLKVMLGSSYANIEDKFTELIAGKFGLQFDKLFAIKPFDKKALEMEHEFLQKKNPKEWIKFWNNITPACYTWNPKKAEDIFISYYLKCKP